MTTRLSRLHCHRRLLLTSSHHSISIHAPSLTDFSMVLRSTFGSKIYWECRAPISHAKLHKVPRLLLCIPFLPSPLTGKSRYDRLRGRRCQSHVRVICTSRQQSCLPVRRRVASAFNPC